MKLSFEYDSESIPVDLTPTGRSYRLTIGEKTFDAEIIHAKDGRLDLLIDGKRLSVYVSSDNAKRWVTVNGQTLVLTRISGARRGSHAAHHAAGELTAPMPGQVRALNVGEGDAVTKGQTLLVLEAMKMEIRIQAPQDGVVRKLLVRQGETVDREQVLIEMEG